MFIKKMILPFLMVATLFAAEKADPIRYIPHVSQAAEFQVKNYDHLLGTLKGLDDSLLKMHFTLYQGYVKNANALSQMLHDMMEKGEDRTLAYGALKRRFSWEFDGMVLHEYYFENLGKSPSLSEKDPLHREIVSTFGSFGAWMRNFMATGLIRGIGWVILYRDPKTGQLNNIWVDDHHVDHIAGGTPILVMDVWEHAYITEYGLDRAGYIESFLNNVNWQVASKRFRDN